MNDLLPTLPPFCSSELSKNVKVKACCEAIKSSAASNSKQTTPPDACSLQNCGRVCNRYFKKRSEGEEEPNEGCNKKYESEQQPSQNKYPEGPEEASTTKQPRGQVASNKPPKSKYPMGPPQNKYPGGPEEAPTTEQPNEEKYPEGPENTTDNSDIVH
ncbi:hypothetical protein Mgra_00006173 [Meloidogyne graminicola]|uniref:Uncharacterized protein n=1 Tax=Meloidogyne graminicola TaxID=189291 RepID=A0A8S9ZMM8_9BILA|nr:hypothetical protein Mgra_00006173 [Meloidogyne graminicola]